MRTYSSHRLRERFLIVPLMLVAVLLAFLSGDSTLLLVARVVSTLALVFVAIQAQLRASDSIRSTPTSPTHLIEDVRADCIHTAEAKDVRLQMEYTSAMPESIETDPPLLRGALRDILRTAIDASSGGTVLLIAHCRRNDWHLQLELTVVDAGSGLSPTDLRSMFEGWELVDDAERLERAIDNAERLRGRLTVKRWPGFGTVFRLEVPGGPDKGGPHLDHALLASGSSPTQSAAGEDEIVASEDLSGLHVLVVDDVLVNRTLFDRMLTKSGAVVTQAENGLDAYECCLAAHESESPFSVVLMDIHMPIMDGFEATSKLRKSGVETPIIAVTADAALGGTGEFLQRGFDAYLPKPIDRPAMMKLLRRVVASSCGARV